jgi:hypothetical protein
VAGTGTQKAGDNGTMRLTWVTDHLAHVIDSSHLGEASGTWTGLTCPDHGLPDPCRRAGEEQAGD